MLRTEAADRRPFFILTGAALLLTAYLYGGKPAVFLCRTSIASPPLREWAGFAYQFSVAFALLVLIPAAALRRPLGGLGFCVGDWRFGLKALAIAIPLLAPLLYLGAQDPAVRAEYPLAKFAPTAPISFLAWELTYLVYYISYESFFRGFLPFGLKERLGPSVAVAMQTLASTLFHIGKPAAETLAAIPAGILFGILAFRTRSIFYGLVLHWYVGALTDFFCSR